MNNQPMYLVKPGMITPVGCNAAMTFASVNAGISQYTISDFTTHSNDPVTVASVPEEFFDTFPTAIEESDYYSDRYDHTLKMAIAALQETFTGYSLPQPVPGLFVFPESLNPIKPLPTDLFLQNILNREGVPLDAQRLRFFHQGRAGIGHAIEFARHYLSSQGLGFVVVGGSDCSLHYPLIQMLDERGRLLAKNSHGGFAPGEGAGFLLLTNDIRHAMHRNNQVIAVHSVGIAEEPGHFYSNEPCLGEGLDKACKQALGAFHGGPINRIYSSMNGERYWSKEFGVARIRNQKRIIANAPIKTPAEYYGDIGAATGPVLMGLAAMDLLNSANDRQYMVQCSSDGPYRASIILSKQTLL